MCDKELMQLHPKAFPTEEGGTFLHLPCRAIVAPGAEPDGRPCRKKTTHSDSLTNASKPGVAKWIKGFCIVRGRIYSMTSRMLQCMKINIIPFIYRLKTKTK